MSVSQGFTAAILFITVECYQSFLLFSIYIFSRNYTFPLIPNMKGTVRPGLIGLTGASLFKNVIGVEKKSCFLPKNPPTPNSWEDGLYVHKLVSKKCDKHNHFIYLFIYIYIFISQTIRRKISTRAVLYRMRRLEGFLY
jgi:hypothetical protein